VRPESASCDCTEVVIVVVPDFNFVSKISDQHPAYAYYKVEVKSNRKTAFAAESSAQLK
jgi:hypothetical protein